MKKMLLVDGYSLFFRAYYATAYTRMSRTSDGIATNAVYGFSSMMNKALSLVKPDALIIAFDSGKKNFRHENYPEYKGTRKPLPEDLIQQFPILQEYCDAIGYKTVVIDGLEADDIIGSLVKRYPDWDINVLSSDRDLLQLIDQTTSVWLMKKGLTEIVEMDEARLKEETGLEPKQIIDLKGLMGDASDNIPGLPGVGEKTALKLLESYHSLEQVLDHVHELKGKLKETVETYQDQARLSKWLATIKVDAEFDLDLSSTFFEANTASANNFYTKYEMKSLIKDLDETQDEMKEEVGFDRLDLKQLSVFPHYSMDNADVSKLLGAAFSDGQHSAYLSYDDLIINKKALKYLKDESDWIVYDYKRFLHAQDEYILLNEQVYDSMLMAFILDSNLNSYGKIKEAYDWPSYPLAKTDALNLDLCRAIALKQHHAFPDWMKQLEASDTLSVYTDIDYPLISVLYEMEKTGIRVDINVLNEIAEKSLKRLNKLSENIYRLAMKDFNINSPKQLAEILFDDLKLKPIRKRSTDIEVLEALRNDHPIIEHLIEYRKYQKLYSTYAVGLQKYVEKDGKMHTVYSLTTAQTGRLSSTEPNLQNISIRDEESREIRKAFLASEGCVLFACDYSQIELRVLAHMADEKALIDAFVHHQDIHTKTAMDVFGLQENQIDSLIRRQAKAVNFGIIYGISDFGLATQINVSRQAAKNFIDQYLKTYSGIENYMRETIEECQKTGYVKTLFNRRRFIPEISAPQYMVREFGKRAAMNAPIQGTAADIIKFAMIRIDKAMKKAGFDSKMLLQVHDELVFDVPVKELDAMKKLVEKEMTEAVQLKVPLEVGMAEGANWYEAK